MGDLASGEGAPSERNLGDVRVCGDGMADGGTFLSHTSDNGSVILGGFMIMDGVRTVSVDDVDNSWGESSLVYEAGEFECREWGEFGGLIGCLVRQFGG